MSTRLSVRQQSCPPHPGHIGCIPWFDEVAATGLHLTKLLKMHVLWNSLGKTGVVKGNKGHNLCSSRT